MKNKINPNIRKIKVNSLNEAGREFFTSIPIKKPKAKMEPVELTKKKEELKQKFIKKYNIISEYTK